MILDSVRLHLDHPFVQVTMQRLIEIRNGIVDPIDVVHAARKEVEQHTKFESNYYAGDFPLDGEGVCMYRCYLAWPALCGSSLERING